ncbi:hypothetical protein [Krasilnikovia sp. M28-CT-15]|uniref:hypothetical protein n=1 Tax=Krasilnikovia sp. M28-CT-15 TaxID=3373540 RepID=UPI0038774374
MAIRDDEQSENIQPAHEGQAPGLPFETPRGDDPREAEIPLVEDVAPWDGPAFIASGSSPPRQPGRDDPREAQIPLVEDVPPGEGPAVRLDPAVRWHPDRVRMWLAGSVVILLGLTFLGQFILIVIGVTPESLTQWQSTITAMMGIAGAVIAFFFARKET